MNRQTKRTLQHEGPFGIAGPVAPEAPLAPPSPQGGGVTRRGEPERASLGARVAQYFKEVRAEMAKVLWPKRSEVVNYSTVVLTTLVLIALLIFGLNYLFAHAVLFLYK